jgi:hypothetical protein
MDGGTLTRHNNIGLTVCRCTPTESIELQLAKVSTLLTAWTVCELEYRVTFRVTERQGSLSPPS